MLTFKNTENGFVWINDAGQTSMISNGQYYGFNGKPAKNTPSNTEDLVRAILRSDNDSVVDIITNLLKIKPFDRITPHSKAWYIIRNTALYGNIYRNTPYERIAKVLENRGIIENVRIFAIEQHETISRMLSRTDEKTIIKFANIVNHPIEFSMAYFENYITARTVKNYLPNFDELPRDTQQEIVRLIKEYPQYPQAIATMARNGLIEVCNCLHVNTILFRFLELAKLNEDDNPNPNGNILNKIYHYKLEFDQKEKEKFARVAEKVREKVSFNAFGFCVVVPTCKEDFVKEGEEQHNCVGRYGYYDRMQEEETYVVFIRREEDPEQSYITCEFGKNGKIKQFLKKRNASVDGKIELRFKQAFQDHLKEVFGK